MIAVKNRGGENEKDGFRTANACQMGCFLLCTVDAKDAFSQKDYGLLRFHSQKTARITLGKGGTCVLCDF